MWGQRQYKTCSADDQVLRYSALALGVFYGFYHQTSLSAQAKASQITRDYQHKESLIQQAKTEYKKRTMPASQKTVGGDSAWLDAIAGGAADRRQSSRIPTTRASTSRPF